MKNFWICLWVMILSCGVEKELQVSTILAEVIRMETVVRYGFENKIRITYRDVENKGFIFSEDLPKHEESYYRVGKRYIIKMQR